MNTVQTKSKWLTNNGIETNKRRLCKIKENLNCKTETPNCHSRQAHSRMGNKTIKFRSFMDI
jgi:hypothetical protein